MRPLRLKLKGFTAFREECTLDLEDFDLFAITGPTGSGKSSLLDALTYALYGKVDRVGKEVRELIAQGQPVMSVTLEFTVGEGRYRVARRTPVKGRSTAVLERWVDGGWRPEPAEGVRGVDAAVERIVGLDYEAFTRSVLLPQNRFAEFLVGDASERRRILTELLGLELFERLGRRAGELRRDAESEGRAKRGLLAREYAHASEEAVARAERARREAEAREQALARAQGEVEQLLARWREAEREAEALAALAGDARGAAGRAAALAVELGRLAEALARAGEEREALAERSRALAAEAAAAEAALAEAEGAWGKAPEVAALLGRAEVLERARAELDRVEAALEAERSRRPALEAEVARAVGEVELRAGDLQTAEAALARADEEYRAAQHRHLAAAVRAGVRVGEPCPVCGAVVERLPPQAQDERGLARAERARERASQALERARRALQQAERARERAALELAAFDRDLDRREAEAERCRGEVAEAEAALAPAFGEERPPPDAAAELGRRAARLDELSRAAREARAAAAAAEGRVRDAEAGAGRLLGEVRGHRVALEALPLPSLRERVAALAGEGRDAPEVPTLGELPDDPAALGATADRTARALARVAEALEERAEERRRVEEDLLDRARAATADLVPPVGGGLPEVAQAVAAACREQARAVAAARAEEERATERLEAARRLEEEAVSLERRAAVLAALAAELRADRIIAFLQLEALRVLAAAASERLSGLSGGRYRLLYQEDEFYVVDTWNGEEARSARTLSGGETFLASLSLALALSEQVRSLAVTERARLESLFLDEGFGTLDPETLETVVEAIERLGSDGRVVGVVTHVPELAVRLPVRLEVVKSPRGSRVQVRS